MKDNTSVSLKDKVKAAVYDEVTKKTTKLGKAIILGGVGLAIAGTVWAVKATVSTAVTGTPTVG